MIKKILKHYRNLLLRGVARKSDIDTLYRQIEGLINIRAALKGETFLLPMRGWAISPDALAWILVDLKTKNHPTILEFGAGQSTVVFASYLRNHGGGRLISVEHDPDYAEVIRRQLAACGLEEMVEFHILPLVAGEAAVSSDGGDKSYALDRLPAIEIDVALIDGPPVRYCTTGRLASLKWALNHIKKEGTIYLDDSDRPFEQEVLTRVRAMMPDLVIKELQAEKGLTVITKPWARLGQ